MLNKPKSKPSFEFEDQLDGIICGVDEVGRGPLAGPVIAAAVIIPDHIKEQDFIQELNDSKKIASKKRDRLFDLIQEHCLYAIGSCSVKEIDDINILQASLLAMKRAVEDLPNHPDHALIDGNKAPNLNCQTQTIIKGDSRSLSIAAASIIAKVTRDRIMQNLAQEYPGYGWTTNAGYGTKKHMKSLQTRGVTPHHRQSFAPVHKIINITN